MQKVFSLNTLIFLYSYIRCYAETVPHNAHCRAVRETTLTRKNSATNHSVLMKRKLLIFLEGKNVRLTDNRFYKETVITNWAL